MGKRGRPPSGLTRQEHSRRQEARLREGIQAGTQLRLKTILRGSDVLIWDQIRASEPGRSDAWILRKLIVGWYLLSSFKVAEESGLLTLNQQSRQDHFESARQSVLSIKDQLQSDGRDYLDPIELADDIFDYFFPNVDDFAKQFAFRYWLQRYTDW